MQLERFRLLVAAAGTAALLAACGGVIGAGFPAEDAATPTPDVQSPGEDASGGADTGADDTGTEELRQEQCDGDADCASLLAEAGACQTAVCAPDSKQCVLTAVADGTACDDGDLCTAADACKQGVCVGTQTVECSDGDSCTTDACVPDAGCQYEVIPGCSENTCGDGECPAEEDCASCPEDCGQCPPECGDGACNGEEDCASCPDDCGQCPPECGDGDCNGEEDCASCPQDCGGCPAACGDGECNGSETLLTCHKDCAPSWMNSGAQDFHGKVFFGDINACTGCHGAQLDGGVKSCETCHPGWQTNCTFCHGGEDNDTGAPPFGVNGEVDPSVLPVGAHSMHVETTGTHTAFQCATCHTMPSDIFTPGHIDGDGHAEVAVEYFGSGSYAPGPGTCSSVYCHSNGKSLGSGDTPPWTGGSLTCGSCHPTGGLSGRHDDHLNEGVSCQECHGNVLSGNQSIGNPALHVNGQKDYQMPAGINYNGNTCSGSCHGEGHSNESW